MVQLCEMILTGALMRRESRRSHFREDFPDRDDENWLKNIVIRKGEDGMEISNVTPVMTRMKPAETEEGEDQ